MICKKSGNKCSELFFGKCMTCEAEFEARGDEIKNIRHLDNNIKFGFKNCTECSHGVIHFLNIELNKGCIKNDM